jgi:predicted RNase H-like HicB family nuclease
MPDALLLEQPAVLWDTARMNTGDLKLKLTAVFEPAPGGGYTCRFEESPGVFSEGETLEEAKANLLDALAQVMEYHREEARENPIPGATREKFQLAAS